MNQTNHHTKILKKLFSKFRKNLKSKIIDVGTGKTSLGFLLNKFPSANIFALTHKDDFRKINSITENIIPANCTLMTTDLNYFHPERKYHIVLAHLLLGEASKFSGNFDSILAKLLSLNTKYFIIIDYLEDPKIDFDKLENEILKTGSIVETVEIIREEKIIGNNFTAKTLRGYLIKKNKC